MYDKYRKTSIEEMAMKLAKDIRSASPVRTGFLKRSIAAAKPTLADNFNIEISGAYYAVYVDARSGFMTKVLDTDQDIIGNNFAENMWDDFYEENKKPKTN